MLAQISLMKHRNGLAGKPLFVHIQVRQPDEPSRIAERAKRPQQESVHQAKNRGAGADAKPYDQDGENREPGFVPKRAERVPQVLKQRVQERQSPDFAMRFPESCLMRYTFTVSACGRSNEQQGLAACLRAPRAMRALSRGSARPSATSSVRASCRSWQRWAILILHVDPERTR